MMKKIGLAGLLSVMVGCTQGLDTKSLSIFIPALYPEPMAIGVDGPIKTFAAPAQGDFDCIRVNVVGRGIPNFYEPKRDVTAEADQVVAGSSCTYPGVLSKALPVSSSSQITLDVPSGANRVIQVAGVEDTGATYSFCGTGPLQFCDGNTSATCVNPKIYELGRAKLGISSGMSVAIQNTYKDLIDETARGSRLMNCGPKDGGGATDPNNYINFVGIFGGSQISIFKHFPDAVIPDATPSGTLQITGLQDVKVSKNEQSLFALNATTLYGVTIDGSGVLGTPISLASGLSSLNTLAVSDRCVFLGGSTQGFNSYAFSVMASGVVVNFTQTSDGATKNNLANTPINLFGTFSEGGQFFYAFYYLGSPGGPSGTYADIFTVDDKCIFTRVGSQSVRNISGSVAVPTYAFFVPKFATIYSNGARLLVGGSVLATPYTALFDTNPDGTLTETPGLSPNFTAVAGGTSKVNGWLMGLANSRDQLLLGQPTAGSVINTFLTNGFDATHLFPKYDGVQMSANSRWLYAAPFQGSVIHTFRANFTSNLLEYQTIPNDRDAVATGLTSYGGMFTYKRQK